MSARHLHVVAIVAANCLVLAGRPVEAAQDTRAVLSLVVNQAPAGDAIVILRSEGNDALVPVEALEAAGLQMTSGARDRIDEIDFVSLRSIAPPVTFHVDEAALELRIQASAGLYARNRLDLKSVEPAGTVHTRDTSGFFNYAVTWSRAGAPLVSGELGVHTGTALITTTLSRTTTGAIERGFTTATVDEPSTMRRFSFGDTTVHGGPLSGSIVVGGFAVSREFALNPYFVKFPTPQVTETLTTPSTVDVYVNDRLVRRAELPPGTFDVTGIPALNGPGQTRLVIRDAFGRSSVITNNYYVTSSVLAQGLQEYQYAIGLRRDTSSQGGPHYGTPVVVANHRVGVTDNVTLGVRADGDRSLVSTGPTMTARAGRFGQVEIAGSVSRGDNAQAGAAGSAAWTYAGRPVSAGASLRVFSASYVSAGDPAATDEMRLQLTAFANTSLGRSGTIGVQHQEYQSPAASVVDALDAHGRRSTVSGSSRIASRAELLWSAAHVWGQRASNVALFAGVSIDVGSSGTAIVGVDRRAGQIAGSAEFQRPLTVSEGLGYRVRSDLNGDSADGELQYQGRYGRYELRQDTNAGVPNTTVNVSGGVVAIGKSVELTRPVQDSYALVRVPGVEGVRVYSSNLEVGRTNKNGNLLVPALLPNYANRVAISDQDLPADRSVPDGEKLVAPPWRGGALITFPSARLQGAVGQIDLRRVDGVRVTPAFGLISVTMDGVRYESPIGSDGTFFFEQLPPGNHAAAVRYRGASCTFTLGVPATQAFIAELGQSICDQR